MDSIAITGAGGQLGWEIARRLGARAAALARADLDLAQDGAALPTLARLRPAAVINCAAYTQVDQAETEPEACFAVNAVGVQRLAQACREVDCPLVQISTDYVFGAAGDRPWKEDDPPAPAGVYARSKLAGEDAAQLSPRRLIVRTCGLYASAGHPAARNFVNTMLRLGQSRRTLRIVNDQRCTPSYAPQVAEAVLFLLEAAMAGQADWGLYHITNQGSATWFEFAAEIFRQTGASPQLEAITTEEYGAAAPGRRTACWTSASMNV